MPKLYGRNAEKTMVPLTGGSGGGSGGGASVEVDATLTKSGMAADAKAAGDEIKKLSAVVEAQRKEIENIKASLVDGNGVAY